MSDNVNHPRHYTNHPSGVECIEITENENFNLGNATKYLWREGRKGSTEALQDIQKALWYVNRERERRTAPSSIPSVTGKLGQYQAMERDKDKAEAIFLLYLASLDPEDSSFLEKASRLIEKVLARQEGEPVPSASLRQE